MALSIYFAPESMTIAQYDGVVERLEAAGAGSPAGRSFHCVFKVGEGLQVFDIWDSQEDFEAFGATLMPLVAEAGIEMGPPMIAEVHNLISG